MCMGPNTCGLELSVGDDLGLDTMPTCCGEPMSSADNERGCRDYTCGDCATVLMVAPTGLVFDVSD